MDEDRVDLIIQKWTAARPDVDSSSMGVIGRVLRTARHLHRELAPVYEPAGLDFGLFDVLATLRRIGPPYRLAPSELNQWCMLTSGAMTARLDRLERAGLVQRLPDPDDRRGLLVELSPAGRALIDELVVEHVANQERLLEPLTADERDQLARLLRKLLATLEPPPGG
ncbi:MAG: MarR family transcriptional regulator [Thermoleophilia bacterium]